jgi:hypothetical protein
MGISIFFARTRDISKHQSCDSGASENWEIAKSIAQRKNPLHEVKRVVLSEESALSGKKSAGESALRLRRPDVRRQAYV